MSDVNVNPPTGPEFEEYPEMQTSVMPDFNQLLANKVQSIKGGFDPHQMMVQKKQVQSGEIPADITVPKQTWPEKDVKALEDFCKQYGLIGFNCGRMSPIAALSLLKKQMGVVDGPIEDRVPIGYKKIDSKFTLNNSYSDMVNRKTLLKG